MYYSNFLCWGERERERKRERERERERERVINHNTLKKKKKKIKTPEIKANYCCIKLYTYQYI